MTFSMDPQVVEGLAPLLAAAAGTTPPPVGDWQTRRTNLEAMLAALGAARPAVTDVDMTPYSVTAEDGAVLDLQWFSRRGAQPGNAALYLHGGGMILGTLAGYRSMIETYVSGSGVPMLAVEYRLAPQHPHPVPVEDCYLALLWLADHVAGLGVDGDRLAVMGDSAGGGLAAGVALLARDRGGPRLAKQILIYPMLDDRNATSDPELIEFLTWTYDDNITGWGALLGDSDSGGDSAGGGSSDDAGNSGGVSPYAAPARATSVAGLPSTYVEVGELDIFRDEDIDYARRLIAAGVSTELHVHPGCPHGFGGFAPDAEVSKRSTADRIRVLQSF